MEFHHAGIATRETEPLVELYRELFQTEVVHREELGDLEATFLPLGESYLELLEPLNGGTIGRYLDRQGPGVHHLAMRTPDIEAALDRAQSMGIELVDETPRPGAWGHDVAFLHPSDTGGVLIEFVASH
ncbi:MAG: methylmalonyl-CoA epimerase [Halobacteriaceae archaeon]